MTEATQKRATEVLRQEAERRAAIIAVQQEVAAAGLDLETVMASISRRSQELTGAAGAVVEMVDGDEMVYRAASGTAAAQVGLRLSRAASLSGLCATSGLVLHCNDSETDERVDRDACRLVGARAMILVPLRQGAETVGVLKVLSPRPHAFEPADVEALQVIAGVLGSALGQAAAFRALREQAALLDLTHSAVLVRDPVTSAIRFWNPAATALYGWTAREAMGRVTHELLRTCFPRPLDEITVQVMRQGRWDGDLVHTTRDGRRIVVDSRWAVQRDADGQATAILEINNDITERRQAEAALEHSMHELAAKTREQETFIYTVSHDLRAPLVSLQGLVGILAEEYGPSLDADGRRYLERINVNASKMQELLSALLDLARIGRIETELAPVELGLVVADVVEQVRNVLEARNATVRVGGSLPAVLGNATRLSQLFTNLLENAVHYTPVDRSPMIRIDAVELADAWEIMVADNGVGIPVALQDKVFRIFQRLPAGKVLNPGGTGVGLAIVSRVVETHGGRLWLESAEGIGTTFHFTLPKLEAAGVSDDPPARSDRAGSDAA